MVAAKKDGETLNLACSRNCCAVELLPDKFVFEGTPVQLPKQFMWVDKDYAIVRTENDFGLGKFILYRTSKEAALLPGRPRRRCPMSA